MFLCMYPGYYMRFAYYRVQKILKVHICAQYGNSSVHAPSLYTHDTLFQWHADVQLLHDFASKRSAKLE